MDTAFCLLKRESIAYYWAAVHQVTLHPEYDYYTSLNEEGFELYRKVMVMKENNQFKDTLTDATIETTRSGMWIRDEKHPEHKNLYKEGECD